MSEEQAARAEPYRMGSLGRHSLIYGIGLVATKAVAFVMLPIYARLLTPADYGVIQLVVMTIEMVTIIAGARIAWGVFRFYHKAEDAPTRHRVLSTANILIAVMYAAAAAATALGAVPIARAILGNAPEYGSFVRIAAISMAFEGLLLVPMSVFQLEDQSGRFVVISLIKLGLSVGLNLLFLIPFGMGVAGVLLSSLFTNVALGLVLVMRMHREVGFQFDRETARGLVRFGFPLMVMSIAAFVVTFGDRYFLNQAGDTTAVGLYGLAYQFGFLVITMGFAPFQRVWEPQRFAVAKRDDRDLIFSRVFVYLNILLLSAALGIALFAGDMLRIVATPPFQPAAAFVPLLAAAYVLQAWGSFLNLGIFVAEKTEYFTVANWAAAFVAVAGYVLLIPRWLAWGAVMATLASIGTRCWLTHVFSQRLWRVEYRWGPVILLSVAAVGIGAVSVALPPLDALESLAAHAGLFVLFLGLTWVLPVLSAEERQAFRERVARVLRPRLAGA